MTIGIMKILGIESSCDETASSLLEIKGKNIKVLSNVISSQIKIHKKYGGVVPEVAARKHTEVIFDVIKKALLKNKKLKPHLTTYWKGRGLEDIDLIAVTSGPGLATSLRVGVLVAQSIASLAKIALVGVNHIEAHLLSGFLNNKNIKFPAIGLIVSGGHTELILIKDFGKYKLIGETRDDAVGEAFDKVAKMLGLGYPGGPEVSAQAEKVSKSNIVLPRPMLNTKDFDFSFSGLKTAVLYIVKKMDKKQIKKMTPQICYEFQEAVIDVLIKKTKLASEKYKVKSIIVGGGVSANKKLRKALEGLDYQVYLPSLEYTGDNASMIAFAGYKKWQRTKKNEVLKIKADANLQI